MVSNGLDAMNFKPAVQKNALVTIVATVAGYFGSAIHGWTNPKRDVLRAERFEVVNGAGKVVSFWGPE
jgi:hypothetical protein